MKATAVAGRTSIYVPGGSSGVVQIVAFESAPIDDIEWAKRAIQAYAQSMDQLLCCLDNLLPLLLYLFAHRVACRDSMSTISSAWGRQASGWCTCKLSFITIIRMRCQCLIVGIFRRCASRWLTETCVASDDRSVCGRQIVWLVFC